MAKEIFPGYNLDIDAIEKVIKEREPESVLIQVPEGLRRKSFALLDELKKRTGVHCWLWGEENFGACDIPVDTKADLVFNLGHSDIPNLDFDREKYRFIPLTYNMNYEELFELIPIDEMPDSVGLVSTIQHVHALEQLEEYLEGKGHKAVIAKGSRRIACPGQILGCNVSAAEACGKVEAYLYLGTGRFHPLAISMALGKPVHVLDPQSRWFFTIDEEERNRFEKQRWGVISQAKKAKTFGILVSTKPGQHRYITAKDLRDKLNAHKKKAYIVMLDMITPGRLLSLGMDAYVVTACPRIAIDDYKSYESPLLTTPEVDNLLGIGEFIIMDQFS